MTAEPTGKRPRNSYHVADDGRIKMIGLTSEETTEFEILLRHRTDGAVAAARADEMTTELRMLELHLKHHRALEHGPPGDIGPLDDDGSIFEPASSNDLARTVDWIGHGSYRRASVVLYIVGAISIAVLFLLVEFMS
jgi:hypothetical protein